ncbi:hypothetical protein LTR70_009481 [Exophiala xenobiotica]|uniref:DUF1996 domain-containing protein n=1 Tax=Lithohypha guttulata TaxID=1690604 RepID=A0ABR0JX96_9EURO|nr:hypothetical protein LTR24_009377 [Lithohypha guttulata]KAK5310413.1 hypothetical protein LTR70_009481 [Exophiala xenobiotica]
MLDLKIPITIPVPDPPKSVWRSTDITQDALRQKAVGFNRLGRSSVEGSLQRHFLPFKDFIDAFCSAGPRLEVMFPSCWDGINTDSSDHRSHVAFPSLVQDGVCGDNFAARIPTLLLESASTTSRSASKHINLLSSSVSLRREVLVFALVGVTCLALAYVTIRAAAASGKGLNSYQGTVVPAKNRCVCESLSFSGQGLTQYTADRDVEQHVLWYDRLVGQIAQKVVHKRSQRHADMSKGLINQEA